MPAMTTPFEPALRALAFLALCACAPAALADVRLPAILSDHMVLQRAARVPVWGWAMPGEAVEVRFDGQARSTRAGTDGRWRVDLDLATATADGKPQRLEVNGARDRIVVEDVLVGEAWLASGQSNMQKPLGDQHGQKRTFDADAEIAAADHPDIRLFKVERARADTPADDVKGAWVVCTPATIASTHFSAAAYYFGRKLERTLHAPVGLIDSTVGGTRIELWTPAAAMPGMQSTDPKTPPSSLYNGMIAGLAPFAIKGTLWYQGESNIIDTDDGPAYTGKMRALVEGWRRQWGAAFPFYYVQVAPHLYSVVRAAHVHDDGAEPRLWEAQADALAIPGTAMVVTTDLVDDLRDIHPRDKKSVGERLANLALARTYGVQGIEPFGPTYRAIAIEGHDAVLRFDHPAGLAARDGQALTWFEIAGADGVYHPAAARVRGERVVASSPDVPAPRTVRFAWHEAAQPNLVNGAGLPALPFRSEHPIPGNDLSR